MLQLTLFDNTDNFNQLSFFDIIHEAPKTNDLESMSESDMIKALSKASGLTFTPRKMDFDPDNTWFFCKPDKKTEYEVHFSRYTCHDKEGQRFISVGYRYNLGGCGGGRDSLEEAIKALKHGIEWVKREKESEAKYKALGLVS